MNEIFSKYSKTQVENEFERFRTFSVNWNNDHKFVTF